MHSHTKLFVWEPVFSFFVIIFVYCAFFSFFLTGVGSLETPCVRRVITASIDKELTEARATHILDEAPECQESPPRVETENCKRALCSTCYHGGGQLVQTKERRWPPSACGLFSCGATCQSLQSLLRAPSRATHLLSLAWAGSLPPIFGNMGSIPNRLQSLSARAGGRTSRAEWTTNSAVRGEWNDARFKDHGTSMFHARRTKAWLRGENSK